MADYYDILEINKNASDEEIKRAYKKLAIKWHPDKNPDNREKAEEKFKEIAEAYSTLSDPNKRRLYDMTGSSDDSYEGHFNSADDIPSTFPHTFSRTFSFGPGMRTAHFSSNIPGNMSEVDPRKIFEEFFGHADPFNEMTGRMTNQSRFDDFIDSPKSEPKVRIQKIPFTLEELYTGCVKKIKVGKNVLDMTVMPGWKDGEGVTYSGVIPDGKLKLAVQELPHNTFKRDNSDLLTTLRITYLEALNGFTKQITMLDKRTISVTLPKIKSSDYVHIVKSEGMPIRKDKKQVGKGDLHINFVITF